MRIFLACKKTFDWLSNLHFWKRSGKPENSWKASQYTTFYDRGEISHCLLTTFWLTIRSWVLEIVSSEQSSNHKISKYFFQKVKNIENLIIRVFEACIAVCFLLKYFLKNWLVLHSYSVTSSTDSTNLRLFSHFSTTWVHYIQPNISQNW